MKWGFIHVTLYMGPIGLLLHVLADNEPRAAAADAIKSVSFQSNADSFRDGASDVVGSHAHTTV